MVLSTHLCRERKVISSNHSAQLLVLCSQQEAQSSNRSLMYIGSAKLFDQTLNYYSFALHIQIRYQSQ
jgi:hypothetical protein